MGVPYRPAPYPGFFLSRQRLACLTYPGRLDFTWYDTLSVLVAKGRAKVSVAASEADWSKRICEMQYADYEDHTVGS